MQTITPVDVHVGSTWRDGSHNGSSTKKPTSAATRPSRQAPRIRTCVTTKTKPNKIKTVPAVAHAKPAAPPRSRTPSPGRDPWYDKHDDASAFSSYLYCY